MSPRVPSSPIRSVLGRFAMLWSRWRCVWLRLTHAGVRTERGARIEAGVLFSVTDDASLLLGSGASIGRHCRIVVKRGVLEIGANTFIGDGCTICANDSIVIGSDALIAERVTIRDQDHAADGTGLIRMQGMKTSPIRIGQGAWIGAGAVILRGVTIGAGAVIGANAVVRSSIPDNAIAVGVPARVVRMRTSRNE